MSFGHMYKVMLSLGQPPLFAALMPLAVDGLMLVASVALARSGRAAHVPEAVPHVPEVQTEAETSPEDVPEAVPHVPEAEDVPEDAPSVPEDVPHVPEVQAEDVPHVPAPVPETESVPVDVPEAVPTLRSAGDANDAARAFIRSALDEGRKVTGAAVAARFGKSDRWGRLRIADVRAEREHVPELA